MTDSRHVHACTCMVLSRIMLKALKHFQSSLSHGLHQRNNKLRVQACTTVSAQLNSFYEHACDLIQATQKLGLETAFIRLQAPRISSACMARATGCASLGWQEMRDTRHLVGKRCATRYWRQTTMQAIQQAARVNSWIIFRSI